jgi:hypothetical protein
MTIMRAVRSTAVLLLVVGLAACAERPAPGAPPPGAAPPTAAVPHDDGTLVLRVGHVGGFTTPETQAARLPLVSVYADGRVIMEGPVAAIYPGPALPNLQVHHVDPEQVRQLVDRALAAGVAETADLGRPPVADASSTRFTLVTGGATHVREVYALGATPPGPPAEEPGRAPAGGLTAEQEAARAELSAFLDELTSGGLTGTSEPYTPEALAVLATPWSDPTDELEHRPVPWPGPSLPGEPVAGPFELSCLTVTGEQASTVLAAAREATALTPWLGEGGGRWSLTFRPLLPDESGCADLVD